MSHRPLLFHAVFNASLDGILVVDHQTKKVYDYNERFLELWRIPEAVARQKSDGALLRFVLDQLKDPGQFLRLVEDLYANPAKKSFDTLEFKDGRYFDRYSEALILDSRIHGRVWFFRDVTLQREAHRALLQSAKMSSLGEMAGGIAHEINNPLTIIQNLASRMRTQIQNGGVDPETQIEQLRKIEDTTQRIAKIIRGLRAFSRNSESDPKYFVKASQIIEETLELCQQKFQSEGIVIRVKVMADVQLKCRSHQISQVLMNLLNNSYSAIRALADKWIEIETELTGDAFFFKVTDSGHGISVAVQERMMEPFFTTREVGQGTGLGLSISKGIVEEHGGELFYDAQSLHTRFVMKFPISTFSKTD